MTQVTSSKTAATRQTKGQHGAVAMVNGPSVKRLIDFLSDTPGINEVVVLGKQGELVYYHSKKPLLKNSVPFVLQKAKQASAIFCFGGVRYVAMQRGNGKKLLIISGPLLQVGLEADERCLQKTLVDAIRPMLLQIKDQRR